MKELLRQIEMDWKVNPTEKEYEILMNYTSKARMLCIVYSSMKDFASGLGEHVCVLLHLPFQLCCVTDSCVLS